MHYKEKAIWTLVTDIHYSPPFSLRLLKVNSSCSAEDSEDNKENSDDKDHCSDTNKEVGVCVCVWFQYDCNGREIKHTNKRWKWSLDDSIFLFWSPEQLQKKLHQLEEQLDYEMQAKDELEHKCKYDLDK